MQFEAAPVFAGTKRFVVERELGQGGMGVVYQALDRERNTRVALKAISKRDALNIYRLKNEFRQLADLSHPNLVTLHELCNEGGSWFFTMELVEGQSFDEYVKDAQPGEHPRLATATTLGRRLLHHDVSATLSQPVIGSEFPLPRVTSNLTRLRHVLRQLVEAIASLHDAGKLHRDIKPSNVLVTREGRVVVLDFGLVSNSTLIDADDQDADRTVGGCVFGTPAYMSPEQASGHTITTASDWYSVGTMLYEALTGQLPFDGSVLDILRQKAEHEAVPPSELLRGVPDDLDQLCRELLRKDPQRRPNGVEILRYLTGHSAAPQLFDAQASAVFRKQGELFLGREQHVAALRAAFDESRGGKPVMMLVHGLSGMGKSALMRCFANQLIARDEAVVLRGRCYERESVPYKAFDNIIDALSRYMMRLPGEQATELLPRNVHALVQLFPVLKRVNAVAHARRPKQLTLDARELRNQGFAALKELLLRITDFQPLVLNIDDLQWADMDSARLLEFLMGPPDAPPLLLVGTYRRDEMESSPFLQHILRGRALSDGGAEVRQLAVDALDASEGGKLAAALLDLPEQGALLADAIAAEAEGVPFFIAELVHHIKARIEQGHAPLARELVALDQVLLERVAGMPDAAQRLLRVLSVAAGPLEQGIAVEAAGLPNGDRSALLALRAARLIRTRGTRQTDRAETYHDRVRETVASTLHPDAIQRVHARIADAMERHAVEDPERLVVHYTGAGDGVRAGETAVQAAHAAVQKLAFNRAAELFRRAIELFPGDDANARDLHRHLGDALANAGRGALAAEAYLEAAEGRQGAEGRKLQRVAAQQYLRSGRIEEGMPFARRLLNAVGITLPSSTSAMLARLLIERARLALTPEHGASIHGRDVDPSAAERLDTLAVLFKEVFALDPLCGTLLQTKLLRDALKRRDPQWIMQGSAWEAINTALTSGESKAAKIDALLSRAATLADELATPYATATLSLARAATHLCLGRFEQVEERAAHAEELFRTQLVGCSWEASFARTWRYAAIELGGDLGVLTRNAPIEERDAREKGDDYSLAGLTLVVPMADMMRDDPAAALEHLDTQAKRLSSDFHSFHLWVMDRTTDTYLYSGEGLRAWSYLSSMWPQFERSFLSMARLLRVNGYFLLGRAAVAANRIARSQTQTSAARRAVRELRRFDRPDAKVYAHLIAGALAYESGDSARAQVELGAAVAVSDAAGMRNFALYAKRNLGLVTGGEAGRLLIAEADAALQQMGVVRPDRWTAAYAPGFL